MITNINSAVPSVLAANPQYNQITFAVPGPITLNSALDPIEFDHGLVIGSANSAVVVLQAGTSGIASGLQLEAANITVQGLGIMGFVDGLLLSNGSSGDSILDNVISGNGTGVSIASGDTGTLVQGNRIGTDATGASPNGNTVAGIEIMGVGNTVGGTNSAAANLISGNATGILIDAGATAKRGRRQQDRH